MAEKRYFLEVQEDGTMVFTSLDEPEESAEENLAELVKLFPTDGHWDLTITKSDFTDVPILEARPYSPSDAKAFGVASGEWVEDNPYNQ